MCNSFFYEQYNCFLGTTWVNINILGTFVQNFNKQMSQKHFTYFLLLIISASILCGCDKKFKVSSIFVYPENVTANLNDTIQLSFSMQYEGGDFEDKNLINPVWTSSNSDVVVVDSIGRIVAKSVGSSIVSISCGGTDGKCNVTVVDEIGNR